jgi:hypothetical protein
MTNSSYYIIYIKRYNMPKKHTLQHVQETFKSKGFVLVSEEYIPGDLLEYKCNNGHTHNRRFDKFLIRPICKECNKEVTKRKNEEKRQAKALLPKKSLKGVPRKFSLDFVKKHMEEQGCKLLSTAYTSDREKLKFVCICGKEGATSFNSFYHAKSRCNNQECIQQRMQKAMLAKYGVSNPMHSNTIKTKLAETNKKKYGVENVFSNKDIQKKIRITNKKKYGFIHANQNIDVKDKIAATNLQRYGAENVFASTQIQNRIKENNFKTFGVEWNGQRADVKQKIKNVFIYKYGTACPMNASDIRKRIMQECMAKYGVKYHVNRADVIAKRLKTTLKRYGVETSLASENVRKKMYETIMRKYGVHYISQNPEIRKKAKATNFKIYGVEHAMQNTIVAEKSLHASKRYKNFVLPSRKIIKLQGYECIILETLLRNYSEQQIFTNRRDMPEIWYIDNNGQYHRYFPDMYIPCDNKVVEVKSVYTYQQNKEMYYKKRKACLYLGFEFESYILDHKHNRLYMHI